MEIVKRHVDYYQNRFSHLLTKVEVNPAATPEEKQKQDKKQLLNDSLFVQELNGFLFRDQGISKEIKIAVIAAIRSISTRSVGDISNLLKRSPQFADGRY